MDTNLTVVQLSPEDAALFIIFQKRHALMKLLESIGAFEVRSGSVEIHFDIAGNIGSIDKHQHYRANGG